MFVRPSVIVGATRSPRTCLQTTNLVAALSSTTNKILIIHRDFTLFVPSYNELPWRFYEENYVWILRSSYLNTIPASLLMYYVAVNCWEWEGLAFPFNLPSLSLCQKIDCCSQYTWHIYIYIAIPGKLTFWRFYVQLYSWKTTPDKYGNIIRRLNIWKTS